MELAGHTGCPIVTAAVDDDGGGGEFGTEVEDELVTFGDGCFGEPHLAKAIVNVCIRTADPEDEIGFGLVKDRWERSFKGRQVMVAFNPAWEWDVAVAGLFVSGIVFTYVNRIGENARVHLKVGVVGVALMSVCINDEDLVLFLAGSTQVFNRDGDVVEHAESEALVWESVMGAACEIGSDAVHESCRGGGDGACGFKHGTFQEARIGG